MDFMRPAVFDILVISNIVIGVVLAGRRLVKDIRAPLADDAPDWAGAAYDSSSKAASPRQAGITAEQERTNHA